MGKHPNSIDTQILKYIQAKGPGWVFTPSAFSQMGSRNAVASALKRHKAAGNIRQLGRGLYDFPRYAPKLMEGPLFPSIEAVAEAIRGRDAVRLQPTGAYAANMLGLSDQVPMKVVFLTDGRARKLKMGGLDIQLRHTTPRAMAAAGRVSGLVIQALRWMGQQDLQNSVRRLRRTLDGQAKLQLLEDLKFAPAWVSKAMRDIADKEAK